MWSVGQARECTVTGMGLRVLTWNLKHGRAVPPAGRDLEEEFTGALGRWDWDVALLQEVPPWWPPTLAQRLGADERTVLTSRNSLLPLRRALAVRRPDLMKSSGGGANAILVRGGQILDHRQQRLCLFPERRWVHAVRVAPRDGFPTGAWIANLHLTVRNSRAATRETNAAAEAVLSWAAGEPAVLGGDFNLPRPTAAGFKRAGGHNVDHVLVCGMRPTTEADVLVRGLLSDHAPVTIELVLGES